MAGVNTEIPVICLSVVFSTIWGRLDRISVESLPSGEFSRSDDNIQFSGLDHDDLLTGVNHRAFAILSMCFQLKTDNQRLGNKILPMASASADGNGYWNGAVIK